MTAVLHRLLFALRPPPVYAMRIGELRDSVRERGSVVSNDRLHVSLFVFPDYPALPVGLVKSAITAGSSLLAAPFYVLFDLLVVGSRSTLLLPSEPLSAVTAFQQRLAAAVAAAGLAPLPGWSFSPHITLHYGDRRGATEPVEPIIWLVEEFVLIHSHVGEGRHDTLARWPLAAPRAS